MRLAIAMRIRVASTTRACGLRPLGRPTRRHVTARCVVIGRRSADSPASRLQRHQPKPARCPTSRCRMRLPGPVPRTARLSPLPHESPRKRRGAPDADSIAWRPRGGRPPAPAKPADLLSRRSAGARAAPHRPQVQVPRPRPAPWARQSTADGRWRRSRAPSALSSAVCAAVFGASSDAPRRGGCRVSARRGRRSAAVARFWLLRRPTPDGNHRAHRRSVLPRP